MASALHMADLSLIPDIPCATLNLPGVISDSRARSNLWVKLGLKTKQIEKEIEDNKLKDILRLQICRINIKNNYPSTQSIT